jgi:S1-C subfamily serine protease
VTSVTPGGPEARAGITTGVLITALNNRPTPSLDVLNVLLSTLKPGQQVGVAYTSENGQRHTVQVVLGDLAQT